MNNQKTKEKMLSWFLDFIQTDLKALSKGDSNLIRYQLEDFYWSLVTEPVERLDVIKVGRLKDLAKDLPIKVERSASADIHVDPQEIQSALKDLLDKLLEEGTNSIDLPMVKKNAIVSNNGTFAIRYAAKRDIKGRKLSRHKAELSDLEIVPLRDIFVDYFFTSVLADLSRGVIKRCQECHRLFAHLSAKRKIYCSSYCAWKDLSRKRREELKKHPREYKTFLKKQRETMKRRYEEKRRDLLFKKPPRPEILTEKLVNEKIAMDAMDDAKP